MWCICSWKVRLYLQEEKRRRKEAFSHFCLNKETLNSAVKKWLWEILCLLARLLNEACALSEAKRWDVLRNKLCSGAFDMLQNLPHTLGNRHGLTHHAALRRALHILDKLMTRAFPYSGSDGLALWEHDISYSNSPLIFPLSQMTELLVPHILNSETPRSIEALLGCQSNMALNCERNNLNCDLRDSYHYQTNKHVPSRKRIKKTKNGSIKTNGF